MADSPQNTQEQRYPIAVERSNRLVPYGDALSQQMRYCDEVARGRRHQTLLLLEHTPSFTLGRNAHATHLLAARTDIAAAGIDVVEVDRGGDITYHGPGQLVAYPILDLRNYQQSVNWYLRVLEDVIIDTLTSYGIDADRLKGYTGVWSSGGKVAAIGVAINNWITYHGIAINIAPDMRHWNMIVPCGIPDKPVTSIAELTGRDPGFDHVSKQFELVFRNYFETQ